MEYYGTTLKEFLLSSRALNNYPSYAEKEQRFSTLHEAQAIDIGLGIAKGMAYLQSLSVISIWYDFDVSIAVVQLWKEFCRLSLFCLKDSHIYSRLLFLIYISGS